MQTLDSVAKEAEFELILQTLIEVDFNRSKAAQKLGVDRKTLYNKLVEIKKKSRLNKPKVVFA